MTDTPDPHYATAILKCGGTVRVPVNEVNRWDPWMVCEECGEWQRRVKWVGEVRPNRSEGYEMEELF